VESVRPALRSDSDACARLCSDALRELAHERGGALYTRRETGLIAKALLRPGGLDRLLADRRRMTVVGQIDDVAVGIAIARQDAVGEASIGVLDALYVEREARGVGVGRMMLDALLSWMSVRGCLAVDASALPGQRETKNFFEAAGFKARLITMHKELS